MPKENIIEKKEPLYCSDLIVDMLRNYGIEYVSANIGSTFRGLWDSLVNYGGDQSPKCISCCHEEIAVAIAHGYAKASGKPMVTILHDTVGLQHATMAIYNAWCDRVPIILLGATGPMDASKRRPWIDWVHTSMIPNEQIRNYVKWDDFPFSPSSVAQSFARAYNIAVTDPTAPVFVCFDSEYLEEKIDPTKTQQTKLPSKTNNPPPSFPLVDAEALDRVAGILLGAENPFIIAGTVGRRPSSVRFLIELAETIGARVYDTLDRFNFPSTHYLDSEQNELVEADVVLALDTQRIESTLMSVDKSNRGTNFIPKPNLRIARIGLDDLLMKSWAADYQGLVPTELSILADTSTAIPKLTEVCRSYVKDDPVLEKKVDERISKAKIAHQRNRERFQKEAKDQWDDVPISVPRLAGEVWELVRGKSWTIVNGDLQRWLRKLWDWEEPNCYLGGSGGAGLGYGLPASIGATLALKNQKKLAINFQPDGDLLFTASAFWTAAHYHVPLLTIVFNNRSYFNDAEHNRLVAMERGRDFETAFHNGGDINDPPVDFAKLARSQGVHGEGPVERPEQIRSALERALNIVEVRREPALVDVVTKAR